MSSINWEKNNRQRHYQNYLRDNPKPRRVNKYSILWFGKYKGQRVGKIMWDDPDYLLFCERKGIFRL